MSGRVGAFRVFLLAWKPLQRDFLHGDSEGTDQENLQGLSSQWLSMPVFSGPATMNPIYNFASPPMCSLCFIPATVPISYIIMDFSVEFPVFVKVESFLCVCVCMVVYINRSEVNFREYFSGTFHRIFLRGDGVSLWPWAHQVGWAGWPASPRDLTVFS